MSRHKFKLDNLSVASPCSVSWDSMAGDARRRLCETCGTQVYNIEGMNSTEVQELISNRRGRLCVRLHRRSDGTVLTRDCPIGVRAIRNHLGRRAAATCGLLLGLVSFGYGQRSEPTPKSGTEIERIEQNGKCVLKGTVIDPNGAVIPGVRLELFQKGRKKSLKLKTKEDGTFEFAMLPAGTFSIHAYREGFKKSIHENIRLIESNVKTVDITLEPGHISVTVGMLVDLPE